MTWINIVFPSKYMLVVIMSQVHNCLGFRMAAEHTPFSASTQTLVSKKKMKKQMLWFLFRLLSRERWDPTEEKPQDN